MTERKRKRVIYVAGKYSAAGANSYSEIEDNIRHAEQVCLKLLSKGWVVLCPHKNTGHYEMWEYFLNMGWDDWMNQSIELLRRCDAVLFMKGWDESRGAREELDWCLKNNMEIYYEETHIPTPEERGYKKNGK